METADIQRRWLTYLPTEVHTVGALSLSGF